MRAVARSTSQARKPEGTWGSLIGNDHHHLHQRPLLHQQTLQQRAATSPQPPESRPHILLFGTTSSGTSTSSSPPSSRNVRTLERENKASKSDELSVKRVVESIESKEETKKTESKKKLKRKKEEEENEEEKERNLSTVFWNAYLRGLGPEARQGPGTLTSPNLESEDSPNNSSSSSAGPSKMAAETGIRNFIFIFNSINFKS